MRIRSAQSIAGRLTALVLLVTGTALLLAYLSFLAFDFYTLRHNLVTMLETEASMIGTNSQTALLFDDQQAAENTLSALRGAQSVVVAQMLQADGRPFARYLRRGSADRTIVRRLDPGRDTQYWTEDGTVLLGHTIRSDGKSIGSVYLLAETRELVYRGRLLGILSAAILLVCFGIAVLATSSMRGFIIRPLENLAETARAVSRSRNYSVRAELPKRRDELAFLVQSFNEMLDQIQKSRTVLEEKVAERTAELSAANRELEAFSYTVAHDLRGPLQNITNVVYLLQSIANDRRMPEEQVWLDKLVLSTQRMSSLIDDLLNFSRAASAPIQFVTVDMSSLTKTILDNLAQGSDRRVEVVVAPDCAAAADGGLITVVLENLLRNAWKYTSRRERARIEFGCKTEGSETVFFVRDNGAGFDPTYADRLFRPFQRLHSQADFPGTGVGLATVYRIITRLGGRVWATGSIDRGAEFCFTLPTRQAGDTATSNNSLHESS